MQKTSSHFEPDLNIKMQSGHSHSASQLPDVAHDNIANKAGHLAQPLEQVGMSDVEAVAIVDGHRVPVKTSIFVNLVDSKSRGIHMSRLYSILQKNLDSHSLNFSLLKNILEQVLETHKTLSTEAYVEVSFEQSVLRKSLKTDNQGYRVYPVKLIAYFKNNKTEYKVATDILYSSTCPASAALSRNLLADDFTKNFAGKNLSVKEIADWLQNNLHATPHNQRSEARVCITTHDANYSHIELINLVEQTLKTPVQAMVKREDEQEFARINGQNSMFCEDAGRLLKFALNQDNRIFSYNCELKHIESLHPHNAVSRIWK